MMHDYFTSGDVQSRLSSFRQQVLNFSSEHPLSFTDHNSTVLNWHSSFLLLLVNVLEFVSILKSELFYCEQNAFNRKWSSLVDIVKAVNFNHPSWLQSHLGDKSLFAQSHNVAGIMASVVHQHMEYIYVIHYVLALFPQTGPKYCVKLYTDALRSLCRER